MLWQPSLPRQYTELASDALAERIADRRRRLGDSLVILGHHYQVDEVIRHADVTGDSLKLSQRAAEIARENPSLRHVVFCGVHFMAETADILTPERVRVILPDLSAGCSMADMAAYDDTVDAWEAMHAALTERGWRGRIVPVTYVNSSAAIKAFVGTNGGACCTSSNADRVFDWAMSGGAVPAVPGEDIKVLFLPDQHLGRNTASAYGIDVATEAHLYDPRLVRSGEPLGGMTADELLAARVVLWAGHCSVHKLFRAEHVRQIRRRDAVATAEDPGHVPTTVIVHPECAKEVVDLADLSGSTEKIISVLRSAPTGSRFAVGTEHNLVNRMASELRPRGVTVGILSDCQCMCTTMYRIDQPHLLWVLDGLCGLTAEQSVLLGGAGATPGPELGTIADRERAPAGEPVERNVISVHPDIAQPAVLALDRMLSLVHAAVA